MITSLSTTNNCNGSPTTATVDLIDESPLEVLSRAATMVRQETEQQQLDESNKQLNKQTTKWKRDRRRLPEYSRKSDPKVPETLGVEPSSPEASISNCPTNPNSCHGNKRDEILHGGDTPLDMTVRQRGEPPSYAQTISNPGYRSSYRTTVMNNGVPPVINRDTLPSGISMCDTVIEEHFRRSLGQDYNAIFQNNNAAKEKEIQAKSPHRASSIVEFMDESGLSVDDHFAKALGETWKQLNKKETINNRENETSLVSAKN
ncbi:hypothetical protein ABEB36_008980 [Hypothenemus hampei]|uniref:Transcription cofactor vestigial-like protein 4 n=1 Tax=Hypothenemus hampei TaxID=57062 RepID=A0ABD1ENN9_HYPHA